LLNFERSDRYGEREKAALRYTSAIVWNPADVDDELWARLRVHFTEAQIVELGYFVSFAYGGQSLIRTMGVGAAEFMNESSAGLAPDVAAQQAPEGRAR